MRTRPTRLVPAPVAGLLTCLLTCLLVLVGAATGTAVAGTPVTQEPLTGTSPTTLTLSGPSTVVDESSARLSIDWHTTEGSPVVGPVTVYRSLGAGGWTVYGTFPTDGTGTLVLDVAPREDSSWSASGPAGDSWQAAGSGTLSIDNVPAGVPFADPAAAPRPAYTPLQARATTAGADPVVTALPTAVWSSMVRRSWHRGCPVGRANLRLLQVNYWGFDGYRYRGEMVLNTAVVYRAAGALTAMYAGGYPIRRIYRVDRFGWSRKLRGANDYASMAADNTSGFNCRSVVNKPRVRSPHASGRAIDLNTWENPYRSRTGLVPNSWWAPRSDPRVAWRSSTHAVVRIWRAWGFRWTYGTTDSQHVDGRTVPPVATFVG